MMFALYQIARTDLNGRLSLRTCGILSVSLENTTQKSSLTNCCCSNDIVCRVNAAYL